MDYKQMIETYYDISVIALAPLDSHFGTELFLANTNKGQYVVKSYPPYMEGAKREGAIADFLLSRGVRAARFLSAKNGDYFVALESAILTVQAYITGKTLPINSAPDWFLEKSAAILGKVNVLLRDHEDLPLSFGSDFFAANTAILKRNEYTKQMRTLREQNDHQHSISWEEQVKHLSRVSKFSIDTSKMTFTNSHGDYHIGQAIIDGEDITIIDWASACKLPACLDVITSFVFACPESGNGSIDVNKLKEYIRIYCTYSPLNSYDIRIMPYVLYYWHTLCNYSPQEDIPDGYKNIAQLVNSMQNWLYENVEDLSEQLCVIIK